MRLPLLLAGYLAAACAAAAADGQTYPARAIRMIVPFAAGDGTDTTARILAPRLGERLGQRVIVDNRAGADATSGTEFAARAAPDGHTLLLASTSELTIHSAISAKA